MASIPKDDVRERLFTVLGDKDSTTVELVSLMLEQVVDDYSVFGWDIEELDTMFVFRPGGMTSRDRVFYRQKVCE